MHIPPAPETPRQWEPIWVWYVVLCLANAAVNVATAYLGFWILQNDDWFIANLQSPPGSMKESAYFFIGAGFLVAVGNLILPFLPKRPWAWVLHLTNIIAAGLTCVLAPLAVPLLIGWFKPAAKDLFDFR